jgi:hypothetical protein
MFCPVTVEAQRLLKFSIIKAMILQVWSGTAWEKQLGEGGAAKPPEKQVQETLAPRCTDARKRPKW